MAIVRKCSCEHDVQDRLHGKGQRVWNETHNGYRCTVCGKGEVIAKTANKQTEK